MSKAGVSPNKGAFSRKQTERGKRIEPMSGDELMKSKDTAMTADNTKPQTSRDDKDDMAERKNLAEIHKRIRLEK